MVTPSFADRSPHRGAGPCGDQRVPTSFIPDTSLVGAVNYQMRKASKTRGQCPAMTPLQAAPTHRPGPDHHPGRDGRHRHPRLERSAEFLRDSLRRAVISALVFTYISDTGIGLLHRIPDTLGLLRAGRSPFAGSPFGRIHVRFGAHGTWTTHPAISATHPGGRRPPSRQGSRPNPVSATAGAPPRGFPRAASPAHPAAPGPTLQDWTEATVTPLVLVEHHLLHDGRFDGQSAAIPSGIARPSFPSDRASRQREK